MSGTKLYDVGDWLVHTSYGIGQIKAVEVKDISGEKVSYFRIETVDSTFWVPVNRTDGDELRPLSSPEEVSEAAAILLRPPRTMSSDHKVRNNNIRSVTAENNFDDIARMVRDLQGRQRNRGESNYQERNAMRALKQQLVEEWALVTGEDEDTVARRIDALLNDSIPIDEDE
jgi:CarD family transcriptional regulator, regulator of rRNA transcription